MAVLQMQRMSICALKKDRKAILEKLQHMGVMEINHILEEDEDFRKMNTANARSGFEKAAASADQALHLLQQYAPVKQTLLSSLEGKDLVDKEKYRSVIENRDDLQRTARRIQALDKERAEHRANILKIENSIESLMPWLPLDVPVGLRGDRTYRDAAGNTARTVNAGTGICSSGGTCAGTGDGYPYHLHGAGHHISGRILSA